MSTRTLLVALTLALAACRVGPTASNYDQLEDRGSAEVYAVTGAGSESSVVVAFENTTDDPLHVSNMKWTILDGEGFKQATFKSEQDIEVPPRAKEKLTFTVATPAKDIATVRLWEQDLEERSGARSVQ